MPASIDVGGETLPRHSLAGGIFKDFSTKDFNSLTSYKGGEKLAFQPSIFVAARKMSFKLFGQNQ